jgi:archaeosine synthase beta-subunit
MHYLTAYPAAPAARDRWVLDLRSPRPRHDPWRYQNLLVEDERTAEGRVARVGTVFLTGRECPWRCAMCDLWRHTIREDTPAGAIPAQVAAARHTFSERPENVTQLKLYNAANFFDPRAVPESDYAEIAAQVAGLARVIVESHPSLVGPRVDRFMGALAARAGATRPPPQLEVAMGLETAHPQALERLHKRMTIDDFSAAAGGLRQRGVELRAFLLVAPPFVPLDEQDAWLLRSIDIAFERGAGVVSLVPTRGGNGAMEALTAAGEFHQPRLSDIERSVDAAFSRAASVGPQALRIFVDLWDLERFAECARCLAPRRARLHAMNLEQRVLPPVDCARCSST